MLRVDGDLMPLSDDVLTQEDIHAALMTIMSSTQQSNFKRNLECDFSLNIANVSRFRVNVFQQTRGVSAVFRVIPHVVPSLDSLHAPAAFAELLHRTRGLVLVTGATGSGKSTTLAAMVHALNQTQAKHIITLEDPIEFVHGPGQGLVTQREVGRDTVSFASGLRAALREDPDVIMVGELRDTESIAAMELIDGRAAALAAEHLQVPVAVDGDWLLLVELAGESDLTERLAEAGIEPSVGSRGDSYDNALAETINGLYKTELIHRRAPWKSREAVVCSII
jgi:pilus retraction protein PilT